MNQYFYNIASLKNTLAPEQCSDITKLEQIGYLFFALLLALFFMFLYSNYMSQVNMELVRENQQSSIEKKQLQFLSESNTVLRSWKHDNQNKSRPPFQMGV